MGLPTKFFEGSARQTSCSLSSTICRPLRPSIIWASIAWCLNRTLSFNGAGGTLRPLARLTHAEMETLYHELFHAYMDYLATSGDAKGQPESVLAFAEAQQHCRYGAVLITPVVQRKSETEERFLSERESWEALNETWAVFVGWTVWNQLELRQADGSAQFRSQARVRMHGFAVSKRLIERESSEAITNRRILLNGLSTRKRFLAPARVSRAKKLSGLMKEPLEFSADLRRSRLVARS